jgi:hypothetical protein
VAWESESWSTGGISGGGAPPLPYIFADIPNQRPSLGCRILSLGSPTNPQRF